MLKKPIFIDEENCLDQASIVEFQLLMQKKILLFVSFISLAITSIEIGQQFQTSLLSFGIIQMKEKGNSRKVVKVCVCACVLWGRVFDKHWGNNFFFKFTTGTVTFWLPIHPHCSSNKMVMCKNLLQQKPFVAKRKIPVKINYIVTLLFKV